MSTLAFTQTLFEARILTICLVAALLALLSLRRQEDQQGIKSTTPQLDAEIRDDVIVGGENEGSSFGIETIASTGSSTPSRQGISDPLAHADFDPLQLLVPPIFVPGRDDLEYCSANNIVLERGDAQFSQDIQNVRERPFSIRPVDFAPNHDRTCHTLQETLDAIKYGERRWDTVNAEQENMQNMSGGGDRRELLPSTFVPRGCDIPAMSPARICNLLNKFSHVVIDGDSLARHLRSGFLMTLSNDLVRGGTIITEHNGKGSECLCDGQFSENDNCRPSEDNQLFNRLVPFTRGLCPQLSTQGQVTTIYKQDWRGFDPFPDFGCNRDDYKGLLLLANGGLHYKSNAERTYTSFVWPMLQDLAECASRGKVTFIWNSFEAQSVTMDQKYPHQSFESGTRFNKDMQDIFRRNGLNVTTINWMQLTKGAQTSDGVHYLAQVNYFKAQYLLYAANLMKKENVTLRLPADMFA